MYNVSQAYKTAMQAQVTTTRLTFTVNGVSYTEENILRGSFHISNQCTDTSDITLGAVYTGQLSATLRGIEIQRNNWAGSVIAPTFQLFVGNNTWESVPLGIYVVKEATHTASGVDIKAYDYMTKLDKNISLQQTAGYLHDFLAVCAEDCGLTLGQTEQQIKALPNGNVYFTYFADNDVETYRDLVSWIAQTSGGFATINRAGQLEIRTYKTSADSVDTLGTSGRLQGAGFSDYITSYTGVSYVDIASKMTRYRGSESDTGMSMNLGQNPFLQGTASITNTAVANILTAIGSIQYVPFKASNSVRDVAYDLGDIIIMENGLAGSEAICCVQRYDFNLHGRYEFQGYGKNPEQANAKSKTDKNIAGLLAETNANEMAYYEYRNVRAITVGDGQNVTIARVKLATKIDTRCQIHINVCLSAEDTDDNDITYATVTYMIDNYQATLQPEETYIDGNHVLHLMYVLQMTANAIVYFIVKLKASSGVITIGAEGLWIFASGLGLVGDGKWNGELDIEENADVIDIPEITVAEPDDSVAVSTQTPASVTIAITTEGIDIVDVNVGGNVEDSTRVTMHKEVLVRITEAGDTRVLEDADTRVTEEEED